MATYSVYLAYQHGRNSYLSVKGRSEWKTQKTAAKHAADIAALKTRTRIMRDLIAVVVEKDGVQKQRFDIPDLNEEHASASPRWQKTIGWR